MTTILLDTKRLDEIAAELDRNREAIVRAFAFRLEAAIKTNDVPYDTGAMVNSVHTRTKTVDRAASAEAAAKGKNPKVEFNAIPFPEGDVTATVGVGVIYAAYVNDHRPFFTSAVERMRRNWEDGKTWKDLTKGKKWMEVGDV